MKNSINLNLVVLLAFLISSCSSSEINNDKNAYTDKNTYNGEVIELAKQLYRKDAATNADILWVGYKRVAKDKKKNVHWFEPKFLPIYENEIAVRKVTEAYTKESQSAVLEAAAKAGTNVANLNLGLEIEGGKASNKEAGSSGNFHIFKLFEVFKLVDELNRDSNRNERERIARNRNPRIVSSIAIAFNQEESAKIGKSSGINLSSSFGKSAKAEVFIRSNEEFLMERYLPIRFPDFVGKK